MHAEQLTSCFINRRCCLPPSIGFGSVISIHEECSYHDQVCASEKNFALLDKLQKNVASVRLRRPCKNCDAGAINITSKLLKTRVETPKNPKVERYLRSVADDAVDGRHSDALNTVILQGRALSSICSRRRSRWKA